ncbi:BLOC-1-related complex subunit 7-like [Styela clava]
MNSGSSSRERSFLTSRASNVQFANQLQTNLGDVTGLFKQISKGSRSSELLSQASRNFAAVDSNINSSEQVFHKLTALSAHLGYQQEAIQKSLELSLNVREQLQSLTSLISKSELS